MKILVVDDETPVAMMIVFLLTRAGFDVTVAHDGRKALELATEYKFDLITLDIDLPIFSGFEICGELKQRHACRHTPIVFVTGRVSEEDRQRARQVGAADYFSKPFEPSVFVSRLISLVKKGAPAWPKGKAQSFNF